MALLNEGGKVAYDSQLQAKTTLEEQQLSSQ